MGNEIVPPADAGQSSDTVHPVTNLRVVSNHATAHPEIHELFRDGGILTRAGRQYRAGQYTLAMSIADCFAQDRCGMCEGAVGIGKCLGRGTPVLRYDGTIVPVENIQTGDVLMGPDSAPRTVLCTSTGYGKLRRIVPVKGDSWVCNDVHMMTLTHTVSKKVIDIPLDEYEKYAEWKREELKLFQPTGGVDFPTRPERITISPYFLGIWLGDGTKNLHGIGITKPDVEIEEACRIEADKFGCRTEKSHTADRCVTHFIRTDGRWHPLLEEMRLLMQDGIRVPDQYLYGSRETRAEVLAGLLDTDGYLHNGGYEIIQKNEAIADGVAFLARSLGMRVTRSDKIVNGETYQRIFLFGDATHLPLRISRKKPSPRMQKKNALVTGFVVQDAGVGDYFGFTLDGDGRFLLGDFTVTHNTFAYLASAILAAKSGQRTVIAVSTNGLLEQILTDIPRLCELMGVRVPYASMKGRSHYICQHRLTQLDLVRRNGTTKADRLTLEERDQLENLLAWIARGGKELTQYDGAPSNKIRKLVTINGEDCRDLRADLACEFFGYMDQDTGERGPTECNLYRAREAAMNAKIVVTNIDVLMWNCAYPGALIGDFDVVIVDEAHELNAKVRDYFSEERGMKVFTDAADRLSDLIQKSSPLPSQKMVDYNHKAATAYRYSEEMNDLTEKIHKGLEKFATDRKPENYKKGDELEVLLYDSRDSREILANCQAMYDLSVQAYSIAREFGEILVSEDGPRPKSDVREHAERLVDIMKLEVGNFANSVVVRANDKTDTNRVFLRSVPIDVGGYLKRTLYELKEPEEVPDEPPQSTSDDVTPPAMQLPSGKDDDPTAAVTAVAVNALTAPAHASTRVLTLPNVSMVPITQTPIVQSHKPIIAVSATLSPDGGWGHPRRQLAMPPDAVTCSVPSPFDYRASAIWYTPASMPPAHDREKFNEAASLQARRLVEIVGGRTLILCSARDDMRVAKKAIEGLGYSVYMQDEMPPKALARRFKEDATSCLIGSKTFGTGFDVPGDALECVILWKLPFSKRTTVDELLRKKFTEPVWKNTHYVPAMLLDLRQWSGRLIRRHGDVGVISIMDSAAIDGKYGKRVMGSMPRGINVTRNLADVDEFLKRVRMNEP